MELRYVWVGWAGRITDFRFESVNVQFIFLMFNNWPKAHCTVRQIENQVRLRNMMNKYIHWIYFVHDILAYPTYAFLFRIYFGI
jgi:hypothetical protein